MLVSVRSAEITNVGYRGSVETTSTAALASHGRAAQHTAMNKIQIALIATALLSSGTALAGGGEGLGVGGDIQLNGLAGPSINYDTGTFHAGGLLAFADQPGDNNTTVGLGGRFFWHVHSTASSDFSIGGQIGLIHGPDNVPLTDDNIDLLYFEPAMQIRAFLAPNVALSFTSGISIGLADADGIELTTQVTATTGLHYYFF